MGLTWKGVNKWFTRDIADEITRRNIKLSYTCLIPSAEWLPTTEMVTEDLIGKGIMQ